MLLDAKVAFENCSGEVCFCLLLHRIFKWMYVDETNWLLVYGGCFLWGMGSEDTRFCHRFISVTLGKLFHQFFLIPNYLLLPFFFSVAAYFVCLDCSVLRDYIFLGMHSSQRGTPFLIAAAVIHIVCAWVGQRRGNKS